MFCDIPFVMNHHDAGVSNTPVGKCVFSEICSWDELLGTVGCFLALTHDLDLSAPFKMVTKVINCHWAPLCEKLSIFQKMDDSKKKFITNVLKITF